ncbi:5'-deoxynucleotidase [Colwellia sp. RSH04]|uniref:5'-deoxynucleotidase n=1 Tax=Colwellia sp. RSH04 TaxID=2305464 RepID=UPI000E58559D|nr:5'-deoxynucleotidase [Colwellia sp. RSH04]RHW75333.1 5'-deoxynucleotidase [Colwellia sp. RSH04]
MFHHKEGSFTAWILRLRKIIRWPLMTFRESETCSQHSFDVAVISHQIALIGQIKFNRRYNSADIAVAALYHEASESGGVGDLPSPLKYHNPELTAQIKKIEREVEQSMVYQGLPKYLHDAMAPIVIQSQVNKEIKAIVKAADDLAAYHYSLSELNTGNREFTDACTLLEKRVIKHCEQWPEVEEFYVTQFPACTQTLDELSRID